MRKLLMLGTSLASREMILYAKSLGVYTIVTDYLEPEKSRAKLISDEYWMINTNDLDTLEAKCREEGVDAVICGVSEFNLEMTMELCDRLGLPSYCNQAAWHYSRDKADFKLLCNEVGVPVPEDYFLSEDLTEEELNTVKFPVVVKPIDLSGNRGISYCYNKEELVEAYRYAQSVSKSKKIVVERMLVGEEWYSTYAIADGEIRLVQMNAMYAQPGQLKNLYSLTTTLSNHVEHFVQTINPAIEDLLKKVGCKEGLAWVQEMLDADGNFYVVEMGYRLPGDMTFIQSPGLCGYDAVKWLVDYALGKKYTVEDLPKAQVRAFTKCGCSYSLWTHKGGNIASFEGIDEMLSVPGVEFFSLYQVGDSFVEHRPLGVFTFNTENCEEMCKMIDKVNHTVSIKDTNGEDVIIRYTDFDYLRKTYQEGLEGK